jgi:hypothetical protein
MLKALTPSDARAIAAASLRRSRDEQAMVEYLGIGRRGGEKQAVLAAFPLLKPSAVDLAAFESEERRQLREALAALSVAAQRELIALIWIARHPSLSFEAALRRTRRIPAEAQTGYLMGQRIERYVAAGLEKLGYRNAD